LCRCGDVLVVTKLDRLARSLPDARDIVAELGPNAVGRVRAIVVRGAIRRNR
jgi:DNA invertase Pin-like site-specific DNA recombinase